jgi:hypothetical protein
MAGDKREVVINAALGVVSILISALLIIVFSQRSIRYEREATDRSYDYARDAERQIAVHCRASIAADRANCVNKAVQTAREYQREEQDLAAQKVSAWWTKIMGAAAVAGVILSAFGVFLVWRTFRAAREGNAISREAMMAENRAWIEIVPTFQFGDFRYLEEQSEFRLKAVFTVKNIGETVALNVGFMIDLIPDPSWFHETNAVADFTERLLKHSITVDAVPLFPEREATNDWDIGIAADKIRLPQEDFPETEDIRETFFAAFCVGVRYNTIFDREGDPPHITTEVGSIRRMHDGRPSLAIIGRKTVASAEVGVMRVFRNLTKVT